MAVIRAGGVAKLEGFEIVIAELVVEIDYLRRV
jgi:hypothetical protein